MIAAVPAATGLTALAASDFVAALASAGYLEEAARTPPPGVFSPQEIGRYRRNADFLSFFTGAELGSYDLQARLRHARVVVVGLGGLGTSVAASLVAAGVGDMRIVDFDTVELSNLNRQVIYTEGDLGTAKSAAAGARLRQINPHTEVEVVDHRIDGVDDARQLLTGRDFLVCAADRPRVLIHEWLNEAAAAEGVAWAWGANAGLTVQFGMLDPGRTGCFQCEERHAREEHPWYDQARRWEIDVLGERDVNPCIAPVSGLLGGMLALDVVFHLTSATVPASYGHTISLDLRTLESRRAPGRPHPDCSVCALAGRPRQGARP